MNETEPKHYLVGRVREALAKDPRVHDLNVEVSISGDKVFLTGKVESESRKQTIGSVVSEVLPDHQICNETEVADLPEPGASERLP